MEWMHMYIDRDNVFNRIIFILYEYYKAQCVQEEKSLHNVCYIVVTIYYYIAQKDLLKMNLNN